MKFKSIFAGFMALVMCIGMMSVTAFAAENTETTITISTPAQFEALSDYSNGAGEVKEYPRTFAGWTIVIANDLDMNNIAWKPLVDFKGIMNGTIKEDGTTTSINNLKVSASSNAGLCANCVGGKFSNLTIDNATITTSGSYAGAFAANGFTSNFYNCDVTNSTIKGSRFVGGITGSAYGYFEKCDITGCTIRSTGVGESLTGFGDNIGGIVGLLCEGHLTINDCHVTNTNVTGARQVGGIAGAALYGTTIEGCTVTGGSVTATGRRMTRQGKDLTPCAGGVVGQFAAGSDNVDYKINILGNTVSNITISQTYNNNDDIYIGWAVGDANTRLNASQYDVSGNTHSNVTGIRITATVTLNEIGYVAANPSTPTAE